MEEEAESCEPLTTGFRSQSRINSDEKQHQMRHVGESHLYIRRGENASSPVMLSFKPVGVYLPVDVNNVAFLQR